MLENVHGDHSIGLALEISNLDSFHRVTDVNRPFHSIQFHWQYLPAQTSDLSHFIAEVVVGSGHNFFIFDVESRE